MRSGNGAHLLFYWKYKYSFDTSDINTDDRPLRRTLHLQNIWHRFPIGL
jgi:hypothetical protein